LKVEENPSAGQIDNEELKTVSSEHIIIADNWSCEYGRYYSNVSLQVLELD
jgi:hypothetical protein